MSGFALVFRALITGPALRHPIRVLLPAIGVAIGVAAVAAIHHANRSVTASFQDAAAAVSGRSDFVVTGAAGIRVEALEALAFLWPIGSFAPAVSGSAVIDDGSREVAQVLGVDWGGDGAVRDVRLVDPAGTAARAALLAETGSVFVSVPFAERHHLAPGAELSLVAGGVRHRARIGGILELSGLARASGGDILVTDIFTAQDLLGKKGLVDRVDIVLAPGVSRAEAGREIAQRVPPGLSLEPPGRAAQTADRMVRAFRLNLNALGSLTLLVGIFLIANAVSIAVLRRRPEIATLRALGASRSAIFSAFLAEGLVIGVAGTLLGEVLGLFVSRAALRAVGGTVSSIYLPTARIAGVGYGGAVWLAAAVGLSAAVLATLLPAIEATRVAPSPAMRPGSIEGVARRRLWPRASGAAVALGAAAALSRAGPVDGFPLFGFAAVALVVLALALAAPLAVRLGAALPGRLLARLGAEGRLAAGFFGGALARNGIAVTALAMALGMTLAMIVTVASIRETVKVWVESTLRSDLWIKAEAGGRSGIVGDLPAETIAFLEGIDGVAAVDPFRARETTDAAGHPFTLASGDFRVVARVGGLPLLDGKDPRPVALAARERGEVLVSEPFARRFGAGDGSAVTVATPRGPRRFRVAGVYRDYSNDRGTVVMDRALYLSIFGDPRITSAAVLARPGVDANDLRRRILTAAGGRFAFSISTNRELRKEALRIFDRTFAVTRALEAIAVGVAILGIANALLASAVERRRSFGLLRVIGASGPQIRRATLYEALLIGLVGTAAAAAAGAGFAWLLLGVINPQSFGWSVALSVPVPALTGAALLVLGASLLAGVVPGRIAAAVNPAAALQEE
ncbi:MAG TPA: FtsX-like permease family protein [Thermoanaerobaculia bacterium]|nr:FtsX-like permease family protein [Thermoanaerobaculia bacterium]